MERDPNISKLIRESGLTKAPGHFTDQVMNKIRIAPDKSAYRPLIGKMGRIFIMLFIVAIAIVALFYSEQGSSFLESIGGLPEFEFQIPQFSMNFDFISESNISTWLVSAFVALFLLVLTDAVIRRKKLV